MPPRTRRPVLAAALCALVLSVVAGPAYADATPTPTDSATPSGSGTSTPDPTGSAGAGPTDPAVPSPSDTPTGSPAPTDSAAPTDLPTADPSAPTDTATPWGPDAGTPVWGTPDPTATGPQPQAAPSPTLAPQPPNDGIGPDLGQYDEYFTLTELRDTAARQLPAQVAAAEKAAAGVSGLLAQRAAADAAVWLDTAQAAQAQSSADDVVRDLYQQGDGGLGAIGTVVTGGPEAFLARLDTVRTLRDTASGIVSASLTARTNLALAVARRDALDLQLAEARTASADADAALAVTRASVAALDAQLKALAVAPPQVAVGPDGCPTTEVPGTLRDGSEAIGVHELCAKAVRQAATPQAALAITWAFQHLGAAYACGGTGRLLPFRADCSSFVSRAFHEGAGLGTAGPGWAPSTRNMVPWDGVALDPHYAEVAPDALRPGDLVLYDTCPDGSCPYKHVVMYLGSPDHGATQWMVHTNACGDVAKVEVFWGFPADGGHPFLVARRVVPVPGEQVVVPTAEQARATLAAAGAPTPVASPAGG